MPQGVPVSILWGADDPWEDMREAKRLFAGWPCVTEFVELPGVGHCPQDEVRLSATYTAVSYTRVSINVCLLCCCCCRRQTW